MAKQTINVGTGPNTGTGEAVRTAFIKVNDNFTEVYGIAQSAYNYANTIVSDTQVDPVARPTANAAFDAANAASSLAQSAFDAANNAGEGSANTGDITFDGVKIIGAGTASGDGVGYSTIELVPDDNLYENDQYLVVDPTQPNHIHIRAGGTQDDSQVELFLGGERNHVRVLDGEGVRVSNDDFNSEDYYFNLSTDYIQAIWSEDENNYFVDIRITDPFNPVLPINPDWSKFFSLTQFPENRVIVYDGNEYYELSILSAFTLGNPYDLRIQVNQAPPTSPDPSTLEIIQFKIYTLTQNFINLEEANLYVEVKEDISFYASEAIRFTTGTGSVQITTDDDDNSFSWRFTTDGELELPASGKITEGIVTDNPTIELTPANPDVESQRLVIKGGGGDDYHLHLTNGDLTVTSLILGTDEHNVRTNIDGSIQITAYDYGVQEQKYWYFDPQGNLTFPDGSTQNTAFVFNPDPSFDYAVTNNLKVESGIQVNYSNIANATGTVTHNCSDGQIFNHITPVSNWTANFTNLGLENGYSTTITLVINQGATGYIANTILIDNSVTTIKWEGNVEPTPGINSIDVLTFKLLKTGFNLGQVIILGQLTNFG